MKRGIVTLPLPLMRMTSIDWDIDWRGQPEAETTIGSTQVVLNAFPRWVGELELALRDEWLRAFRAHRWAARGRTGIYRIYMFDPLAFNISAIVGRTNAERGLPFATGQRFATGSGFAPNAYVSAAKPASAGDSSITVATTDPDLVPIPGQILSADDWPMGVTSVLKSGNDSYTLNIEMPLRADIAQGDPIACLATGLFEVAEDRAGAIAYGKLNRASPSITFREVLTR